MILSFLVGAAVGALGALAVTRALRPAWTRALPAAHGGAPAGARPGGGNDESGAPARESSAREELRGALANVVLQLGARRAILWDVDLTHDLAHASAVTSGEHPPDLGLQGDAVGWALSEQMPLRLTTSQRWSRGGNGGVVPLRTDGAGALVTLEFAVEADLPDPEVLGLWGAYLKAFIRAEGYQADAAHVQATTDALLDVLEELPKVEEVPEFAGVVTDAARRLAGVDGAALALWDGEHGEVIGVASEGNAPPVGSRFGLRQSVLGLVPIRNETVAREHLREASVRLPVLTVAERWPADPRAAAAFPLLVWEKDVPEPRLVGILGIWSIGESRIDERALKRVETVVPYAAKHLAQLLTFTGARHDSRHDPLTKLPNRRAFEERLAEETHRYTRYGHPVALVMLDIDHFKKINDSYGHDAGDEVLATLGRILQGALRETDLPARLGGEEFVAILPETTLAAAADTAERLRARVEANPVSWHGESITVTASFGVAAAPDCVAEPRALLESADGALYAAKSAGRNRVATAAARARR